MTTVIKKYRITFNDGEPKDYMVEANLVNGVFESFGKVADRVSKKTVPSDVRDAVIHHIDSAVFPGAHLNNDYDVIDMNPEVDLPQISLTLEEALKIINNSV